MSCRAVIIGIDFKVSCIIFLKSAASRLRTLKFLGVSNVPTHIYERAGRGALRVWLTPARDTIMRPALFYSLGVVCLNQRQKPSSSAKSSST